MKLIRLSVTLLCVSSCASPPPPSTPDLGVEVPKRWTAEPAEAEKDVASRDEEEDVPYSWWHEYDDPVLDAVVADVLDRNYDLEIAVARVYGAAALSRVAGADALPLADAAFDADQARRNFIGFPIPGGADVLTARSTSYGVGFNVTWELDVWGRIRAGQSAALADLQVAQADAYAARLSIIGQTVKLWFFIVETRGQLDLAQATLVNFRSNHQRVLSRYERGLRPSLDVRFSLTNIAAAAAVVQARSEDLDRLIRQLKVLLGRYPDAVQEIPTDLPSVPGTVPDVLPSELVYRRPDIVASERRLAATGARVKEAKRALLPRISLRASGGTSSSQINDLADPEFSVWRIGANVVQPFFQGGRLLAGIDLAKSDQREALAFYVDTTLEAFREVESALAAEKFLDTREQALEMAAEQSIAARDISEGRYDRGLDDIITVLEAQRRAFDSKSALLVVQRERLENNVDLHLAVGGDFHELNPITDHEPSESPESAETTP